MALTIESLGNPTNKPSEIIQRIRQWLPIRRELIRKFKPVGYYFQAEFNNDRVDKDSNLLSPHCHGIMALSLNTYISSEIEYLQIKEHIVHKQLIYDLSGWINYTLKDIQHPPQLANKKIKLFSRSKGLF